MKKNKRLSVVQYSELCGVTKTVIYNRIKKKKIKTSIIDVGGYPTTVIDVKKYPPTGKERRGRIKLNDLRIKELRKY
jgi:hypothetical protein